MILIRSATPDDAIEIASLVNSAYRGESSRIGWTTEADLITGSRTAPELILELISSRENRIELLIENGELKACVQLRIEPDESLYLGMLSVRPTEQARGFGKMLLEHAETLCRRLNLLRVRMTVINRRIELLAYYERRGYVRTGKQAPFHMESAQFGIANFDDLVLLELEKTI